MILRYGKINGLSIALINIICLGAWFFGAIVMSIINLTGSSGEWESDPIGCILVLILLMIYKCFPKGSLMGRYQLALSMSCTRKGIMKAEIFWGALVDSITVLLLLGLYHLEMFIYSVAFPGASSSLDIGVLLHLAALPGIVALFTAVPVFMAAMWELNKWVPYVLWVCLCFSPALFSADRIKASYLGSAVGAIKNLFLDMPPYGVGLTLLGMAAILMLPAIKVLGKQDVRL